MQHTNEKIIAELYAVRAGLSLISREYEAVKVIQDGSRQSDENAKAEAWSAYEKALTNKEKVVRDAENAKREASRRANECKSPSAVMLAGFAAALVCAFVCWVAVMTATGNFVTAIIAAVCLAAAVAVGGILIDVILYLPKRRRKKRESAAEAERCEIIVMECNKEIEKAERTYNGLFDTAAGKRRTAETESAISGHIAESGKIRCGLINCYGSTITESDWQNIDLIIFYFRSGRAETLREALQLADRQRQTEAIIMEIRRAAETICGEIRSAAETITRAVGVAVKTLGAQLEAQHIQLMGAANCENLLLKALKDKADIACEELVKQSKYLASLNTKSAIK